MVPTIIVEAVKNFFKGISFSQIGAGALAAVTSFLLSAKIGLAGSVIGVAIGSIVSAVSSQIYQNVLKESSKKLQEAAPFSDTDDVAENAHSDAAAATDGTDATIPVGKPDQGRELGGKPNDTLNDTETLTAVPGETTSVLSMDHTQNLSSYDRASGPRVIASDGTIEPGVSPSPVLGSDGSPHVKAPRVHNAAVLSAAVPNTQRNKRIAVIVSVVSALVAVLITAGIITVATRGKGTDNVVRNWTSNSSVRRQRPSQTPTPDQQSSEPSVTPTPSDTPSPSDSASPSAKPSPTPSDTPSPSDSASPSAKPSPTPSDTPSPSDSASPSAKPSSSSSGSAS